MKRVLIFAILCGIIGFVAYTKRLQSKQQNTVVLLPTETAETTPVRPMPGKSHGNKTDEPSDPDLALLKLSVQNGNYADVEGVMVKLTTYLKERPELLGEVLEGLKTAIDANYLTYLTKVIEDGGALTNKLVAEAALDIAKGDFHGPQQHAALSLLSKIPEVSAEMSKTVRELANNASDPQIRNSAVATMADWMTTHPDLAVDLNNDLLRVAKSAQNPEVRGNALQVIGVHLETLPASFTTAMAEQLQGDAFSRTIAAHALGSAPENMRDFVLPKLQEAFQAETDVEIRRTILSSIVRTGRGDTLDILEKLSNNPAAAQDIREYIEILRSGVNDPAEVLRQKSLLDEKRVTPVAIEEH